MTQKSDPRHAMRWVMMVAYLLALLIFVVGGVVIAYISKSPNPLIIPIPPLLLALRPITRYLFEKK